MSNKTQLQTNNTALDGYIARINAAKEVAASLPEAGSGGSGGGSGAGVETCTVSIKYAMASYFCSVYRDGVITDEIATDYRAQPTIANVICNSIFVIRSTVGHESAENATLLARRYDDSYAEICIFRADAPPNGEIVIEFG